MEKQELHEHIADMLERIAHLNKNLSVAKKILPVEIDLLKGYMSELDKSFDALINIVPDTPKEIVEDAITTESVQEVEVETTVETIEDSVEEPSTIQEKVGEEPDLEVAETEIEEEPEVEAPVLVEVEEPEPEPEVVEQVSEAVEEAIVEPELEVSEPEEEELVQPEDITTEEEYVAPVEEIVEEELPSEEVVEEEVAEEPEPVKEEVIEEPVAVEAPKETAKGATSLNERFSKREGEELGYRIKAPMQSLKAMIDLSEKYVYTKELFGGDKDHFESTLKYLDQCSNLNEANEHITNVVRPRFKWDDKKDIEKRFKVLLEKRFN